MDQECSWKILCAAICGEQCNNIVSLCSVVGSVECAKGVRNKKKKINYIWRLCL